MMAIDDIDLEGGTADGNQVAVLDDRTDGLRTRKNRELLGKRINFLSVDVRAVAAPQVADLNLRQIDVQLAMMTRNELVSFRSRQLHKAIQGPSHLTSRRPTKAKLAVLVGASKYREPNCGSHGQASVSECLIS